MKDKHAIVLIADKTPYFLQALTAAKSLRDTGTNCDIILIYPPFDSALESHLKGPHLNQLRKNRQQADLFLEKFNSVFNLLNIRVITPSEPPFCINKIKNKYYKDYISKSKGKVFLYKTLCWTFTEYEKVAFLDADMLVRHNLDDALSQATDFLYVDGPASPLCDAFFVCRPNLDTFNSLIETIHRGNFHPDSGWDNKGRVHKNFNAIAEGQGLFYYHFIHEQPKKHTKLPRPHYNNYGWTEVFNRNTFERHTSFNNINIVHFTAWQKPFHPGFNYDDLWKLQNWGEISIDDWQGRKCLKVNDGLSAPGSNPGPQVPFHEEWKSTFLSLNITNYRNLS